MPQQRWRSLYILSISNYTYHWNLSKTDSCSIKYTGIFTLNLKIMLLFSHSVMSGSLWAVHAMSPSIISSFSSVQFSLSVMSSSLWAHGLQHARLPCPSLSPRTCSNSCPLSQWCHPTISSSVVPFSSSPQSFPASGPFPMSWRIASVGQITL